MVYLPVEVLRLIFEELSSLKDIQQCYSTCLRWRKIITKMFKNKSMYLSKKNSKIKYFDTENKSALLHSRTI